jgi:hypothetical protein
MKGKQGRMVGRSGSREPAGGESQHRCRTRYRNGLVTGRSPANDAGDLGRLAVVASRKWFRLLVVPRAAFCHPKRMTGTAEARNIRRIKSLTKQRYCEAIMKKQPSSLGSLLRQLLWHCLMGTTLGVICGGLLLQIGASQPDALIHGADTIASRLRLLLTVAFIFAVGATLTGASFLAHENEQSRSR